MKLGIMQPYLFPYIGYFQLIASVDKFIIYDDVTYIKGGWINRNNILVANKAHLFTIPLDNPGSFVLIKDIALHPAKYELWKSKFLKTLSQSYNKAPYYKSAFQIIERILSNSSDKISTFIHNSLIELTGYFDIHTEIVPHSEVYQNSHLKSQDRIIDICKKEKASRYINSIGGKDLYDKTTFLTEGIELQFIQARLNKYKQWDENFIPGLSIIDLMMFNSQEEIKQQLKEFSLL